ncbi:MAG: cation transporter [Bdellovibrionales bacterium]|nr:cation transporter [Bdellovibrionales bacterium]MCB0414466.1 cation transporter [Bdellovibrionales bacterium]
MGSSCCGNDVKFDGASKEYKKRLWVIIFLNALMFVVEISGGFLSKSQALKADALDFLGDTLTYGLSLFAIDSTKNVKLIVSALKGMSLLGMGLWVAISTGLEFLSPMTPRTEIMGFIGFLALCANVVSVLLLIKYKEGDANIRSVWLCSRNDAIGNIGVIVAALVSSVLNSGIPDLIVASFMSVLFVQSSIQILVQCFQEWKEA